MGLGTSVARRARLATPFDHRSVAGHIRRAEAKAKAAPGTAPAPHARHGRAAGPAPAAKRPPLGNTAPNPSALRKSDEERLAEAAQRERRAARYGLRNLLWRESSIARIRNCGRLPVHGASSVGIVPGPRPGVAGVQRCASPSACPVCAASIGSRRREEVGGVLAWAAAQGFSLALVTLTLRHKKGMKLAELWDATTEAWGAVTTGRAWAGESEVAYAKRQADHYCRWDEYIAGLRRRSPRTAEPSPRVVGIAERFGVVGWVRAFETTHGENGWHPHLHVVAILDPARQTRMPGWADAEIIARALGIAMHETWERTLNRRGLESWRDSGGLDVRTVTPDDEQTVADYLLKGMSAELTLGAFKEGRGKDSRTPFQILADLEHDGDEADLRRWRVWEQTAHGRKLITWSQGLREAAKIEVKDDAAIIAEECDGTDEAVLIESSVWTSGVNRRTAELLDAATDGAPAVCALLDAWAVPWTIGANPFRKDDKRTQRVSRRE